MFARLFRSPSLGNFLNLTAIIVTVLGGIWWFTVDVRERLTGLERDVGHIKTSIAIIANKFGQIVSVGGPQ